MVLLSLKGVQKNFGGVKALRNANNIEIVLIDTEAHKAVDVFYVTRGGAKLDEAMQDDLRSGLLRAAEG
jgi:hypothetical protein